MDRSSRSTIGVILAGGQGRRFGGVAKGLLDLAGRPLLAHVIERIRPQVREIIINANGDTTPLQVFGCPIVADQPPPVPANGPLTGLVTVLSALEAGGDTGSFVLTVPVDTPFLPHDLRPRLASGLAAAGAPVAFAASAGRTHPIIALWSPVARPLLAALFVQQSEISLHGVMERLGGTCVDFDGSAPVDAFFNVNRPEDLGEAERVAAIAARHP